MLRRALGLRFRVLAIRDFRLLLADRLLAPASAGFSLIGVSFAVLNLTGSSADLSYVLAALIAGPIAAVVGVSTTQFAAAGLIVIVSALCLIPRDVRTIRSDDIVPPDPGEAALSEPVPAAPR
jgi:hypothetical protein